MAHIENKHALEMQRLVEQGAGILKRAQSLRSPMEGEELAEVSSWVTRLGQLVCKIYGEKSQQFSSYSKAVATQNFYCLHSNWNAHIAQLLGVAKSAAHDFEKGLIPVELSNEHAAISEASPSVNLGEMNIRQLLGLLKPAQLWGLLGAIVILIVGSFGFGAWIITIKSEMKPPTNELNGPKTTADEERVPLGLSCTRDQTFFVETGSTNQVKDVTFKDYNGKSENVTNRVFKLDTRDGKLGVRIRIEFNRPVTGTKIFAILKQNRMTGPYKAEPIDPSVE